MNLWSPCLLVSCFVILSGCSTTQTVSTKQRSSQLLEIDPSRVQNHSVEMPVITTWTPTTVTVFWQYRSTDIRYGMTFFVDASTNMVTWNQIGSMTLLNNGGTPWNKLQQFSMTFSNQPTFEFFRAGVHY